MVLTGLPTVRSLIYAWNMHDWREQLAEDYERILSRLAAYARKLEVNAPFSVYAAIEELKEKFGEAEDWTEQEVDELLEDIETVDSELRQAGILDWLRLDAKLIEEKLVSSLTDETKLAWLRLRQQGRQQRDTEQDDD